MVRVAIGIVLLLLVTSVVAAEPRIALIVTNQAYTQVGASLTNTHRDGELVKGALEKVGFKTWIVKDTGNENALLQAIGEHVRRLTEAGPDAVGFFYYSGHGAADRPNGENYLIPTNVPLTHASQLPLMAVKLEKITATLTSAGRMSFVVFDACRNVPLLREQKDFAFKGFAPIREQRGLLVAFATESGNVAVDQSVYAKALADEIVKPGVEAGQVFRAVTRRVIKDTQNRQSPEYLDKRLNDFHFTEPISTDKEMAALRERVAKMEKHEQQIGAGAAKEIPKEPKISSSLTMSTIRNNMERIFEDEKRKEGEQKPQGALSRCESYSTRISCVSDDRCTWADDRKQCIVSLATASLEEIRMREGYEVPGSTFRDCPDCPEMVVVPAGSFMMGSPMGEEGRGKNEGPQRTVTIAKPFAVGKFEVTFAEWDVCVAAGGCLHKPSDSDWGRSRRPVINVSWDEITNEFLPWLSRKSGKTYRLLTEAEWEYAARAGTTRPFSTGGAIATDQANFNGDFTSGSSVRQKTVEVGSFKPNGFGLHDMHGNVGEWVEDCYKDTYPAASTDGSAVISTGCTDRVLRGGSWDNPPWLLRSAFRERNSPHFRRNSYGFRLARTLSP
jgi:formylglycine-generating enzyme required for sulfatase activity